tara:strand:- start:3 stop:230 length:228 start_codon:yes stop_codon:yes gene_type:complete
MFKTSWLPFSVYFAYKSSSLQLQVFNQMKNLGKASLELSESQLLSIKDQIKTWSTKEQVIDIMRYRYGRIEDQAA